MSGAGQQTQNMYGVVSSHCVQYPNCCNNDYMALSSVSAMDPGTATEMNNRKRRCSPNEGNPPEKLTQQYQTTLSQSEYLPMSNNTVPTQSFVQQPVIFYGTPAPAQINTSAPAQVCSNSSVHPVLQPTSYQIVYDHQLPQPVPTESRTQQPMVHTQQPVYFVNASVGNNEHHMQTMGSHIQPYVPASNNPPNSVYPEQQEITGTCHSQPVMIFSAGGYPVCNGAPEPYHCDPLNNHCNAVVLEQNSSRMLQPLYYSNESPTQMPHEIGLNPHHYEHVLPMTTSTVVTGVTPVTNVVLQSTEPIITHSLCATQTVPSSSAVFSNSNGANSGLSMIPNLEVSGQCMNDNPVQTEANEKRDVKQNLLQPDEQREKNDQRRKRNRESAQKCRENKLKKALLSADGADQGLEICDQIIDRSHSVYEKLNVQQTFFTDFVSHIWFKFNDFVKDIKLASVSIAKIVTEFKPKEGATRKIRSEQDCDAQYTSRSLQGSLNDSVINGLLDEEALSCLEPAKRTVYLEKLLVK